MGWTQSKNSFAAVVAAVALVAVAPCVKTSVFPAKL
jgi:hypothetical protein